MPLLCSCLTVLSLTGYFRFALNVLATLECSCQNLSASPTTGQTCYFDIRPQEAAVHTARKSRVVSIAVEASLYGGQTTLLNMPHKSSEQDSCMVLRVQHSLEIEEAGVPVAGGGAPVLPPVRQRDDGEGGSHGGRGRAGAVRRAQAAQPARHPLLTAQAQG